MEITPISQRDPRWANILLGTSNVTIGGYGCTITCLTMLLNYFGYNETPITVNNKLKANGGYASGNLLVWTAIPKIWTRMKFEWRGYGYDNDQVANNLPCLVEVDFDNLIATPRDRHWILFKGDRRMNDPWTGLDEPTSKYSILTGYAVITGTQSTNNEDNGGSMSDMYKGIDLNNKESVKVAVDLWADIVQNGKKIITKDEYESLLNDRTRKGELEIEVGQLNDKLKNASTECTQKVAEKEAEVRTELNGVIDGLTEDLSEATAMIEPLNTEISRLMGKQDELAKQLTPALGQIDMIKRVGYQSFNVPTSVWDKEETILSHLTSLSSGGNPDNWSIFQLIGLILTKLGKITTNFKK